MQHTGTQHEIVRLRHAEAVRRAERVGAATETTEGRPAAQRASLRWGIPGRLAKAARARVAPQPGTSAA